MADSQRNKSQLHTATHFRPIVKAQDAAHHVLIDLLRESECDLLSDAGTSPTRILPFHFHHGIKEVLGRSFGPRSTAAFGAKQQLILPLDQDLVKMREGRRLQHNGRPEKPSPADEKHT